MNIYSVIAPELEEWIYIDGKKTHYKITTYGRVFSMNYKNTGKKHELALNSDKDGYRTVTLSLDGVRYTKKVHRLVGEAFIPNPNNKPQINHKDNNPGNNHVDNLEWNTAKENIEWSYTHGFGNIKTENLPVAKYQEKMIHEVCKYLEENKKTLVEISDITNVSIPTIHQIKSGNQWLHISKNYKIENYNVKQSYQLTDDDVHNICKLLVENKKSLREIADLFEVRYGVIQRIYNKTRWIRISDLYDFSHYNVGQTATKEKFKRK